MNMLNIPIAEPSVPSFMCLESIAKGKDKVDAQPIPAKPIAQNTVTWLGKKERRRYAKAIKNKAIAWILLLPLF